MWWEPETEAEQRLAGLLPQLVDQFLKELEKEVVWGVGSFFPSPYTLWASHQVSSPWQRLLMQHTYRKCFGLDYDRRFIDKRLFTNEILPLILVNQALSDSDPVFFAPMFFPDLPLNVREQIAHWEIPPDTIFLFVSRPEPVTSPSFHFVKSGFAVRCRSTNRRGTIGPTLIFRPRGSHAKFFLTVGHLTPMGQGSIVELVEPRFLRATRYRPIGEVVVHSSPQSSTGQPGYDAAIVEVKDNVSIHRKSHQGVASIGKHLRIPLLGTVYGSVSGIVKDVGIVGSLNAYGSPPFIWKNSWLLNSSGKISRGDSGAAFVLNSTQQIAGMVVGGSRVHKSKHYMVQYAHDIKSLHRDFLNPAGYSIT